MKPDAKKILATRPKFFRSSISYAAAGSLAVTGESEDATISNVSMISRGEALGHDFWIDTPFLAQVYQATNAAEKGIKSRFTHPGMSSDGLGSFVGRVSNAKIMDDQVVGDLRFAEAARISPGKGDLARYISQLAADDPEAFGMSIVFESDVQAERDFFEANGGVVIDDPEMGLLFDNTNFVSPDPLNTKQLPHARLANLRAVDFVDEPAANQGGLFTREQTLITEADSLAAYALGFADHRPELVQLDSLDADRVRGFVTRFLTNHKLEVRKMADAAAVVEEVPADVVAEQTTEEVAAVGQEDEAAVAITLTVSDEKINEAVEAQLASGRIEAQAFLSAFGEQGAVWFAQGLSMEQARDRQLSELKLSLAAITAERDKYKTAAQLLSGEKNPVTFEASDKPQRAGFASKIRMQGKA